MTMNLNPKTTAILNKLIAKATELHQQNISAQIEAGELTAEDAQCEPIYHYFDAHPYIQEGDLIDNPAVWFLRSVQGGLVFAIQIQTPYRYDNYAVKIDLNSHESVINRKGCTELADFCQMWMKNVEWQQNMKKW